MTLPNQEPKVLKHLFWRRSGDADLATALHLPKNNRTRKTGVVICPPIGHEHVHTFRTFRVLADSLATSGFPTIRFEYQGTGNSSGQGVFKDQVQHWIKDIRCQAECLQNELQLDEICLVGFRISTLLATAAIADGANASMISWAQRRSAKAYARELRALSRMSDYEQNSADLLECGGFTYSREMLDDIAKLEQQGSVSNAPTRILRISTDQLGSNNAACGESEVSHHSQTQSDLEDMMLEPHLSIVPTTEIDAIVNWLSLVRSRPVDSGQPTKKSPRSYRSDSTRENIVESMVWRDKQHLAGIICRSKQTSVPGKNLVLLPNAGSVHSMGPNRVYVEVARTLARNGIDSLRFDLPNLGEAVVGNAAHENEPYLEGAGTAVLNTIDYLRKEQGYESIIIAGLCSGSYNAFLSALQDNDSRISGVIMINPLTFHWEEGMPFRLGSGQGASYEAKHYSRALWSKTSWLKFVRGKVKYRKIFSFAIRYFHTTIAKNVLLTLDRLHIISPTRLAKELRSIAKKDIPLSFVFSSRDPGLDLLRAESRSVAMQLRKSGKIHIETIEDADHTFSQARHRYALSEALTDIIGTQLDSMGRD